MYLLLTIQAFYSLGIYNYQVSDREGNYKQKTGICI